MRGILSSAGYVPYRRLRRSSISQLFGSGGGKGFRSVAGHDEDTTTMGLEAARLALRSVPGLTPDALWFATAEPAYLDKTNATAIHAALRLPQRLPSYDFGGALRSGVGALKTAMSASGTVLVVVADQRNGLPTSSDESSGGDGAAAMAIGDDDSGTPVIAEYLGGASISDEFVDRWRSPGQQRSRVWEERFGETRYVSLGRDAWSRALKEVGISSNQIARVCVTGMHGRAVRALSTRLGVDADVLETDYTEILGQTGAAHPALVMAAALEAESMNDGPAGRIIAVIHLADGADIMLFRTTGAVWHPHRTIDVQVADGAEMEYGKFLAWRGMAEVEPPRRPEPQRVSSTAAWRNEDWKFGFVGSKDRDSGAIHMPPARISMAGDAVDDMEPIPMADVLGTVVTFTIDRMAYSPSPPVVFAVVDFDGGGRFPMELTDVDPAVLAIGDRVEMTFRRLYSADGIHDYFWKATPIRREGITG
jgi:hydroxymethylglutaryl-CoA synthase